MAKGRFGNVITFDYEYDYYTKNKYKNRSFDMWEIATAPYYKFSGKVKGGLRLAYREKDYKDSKNNRYNDDSSKKTVALFMNYDPTLRLNVYAEAGFSRTDYEGDSKDGYGDGDPTLAGLDFYRTAIECMKHFGGPGVNVSNVLQTNGTLLTKASGAVSSTEASFSAA